MEIHNQEEDVTENGSSSSREVGDELSCHPRDPKINKSFKYLVHT